ncbi:MAG: DUF1080 domain-containing protein [Planctomycetes bacterium]|nr:DUF1080 domain-containing protein [Planctomycetota bacterium]
MSKARIALITLVALGWVSAAEQPLFDGKSFAGWEGDTAKTWRIEDGAIVAGDLNVKFPRNEFLATTKSYKNFVLRLEYKIEGTEGFVNSGVQIRSVRIDQPAHEMRGYQADIGKDWSGSLYDESRRNKVLAKADPAVVAKAENLSEWNRYEIRCEGPRIILRINGTQTVDYTEMDATIPLDGHIAVQIHGDGKTIVRFRNLTIEQLPD